jgi:ribosomal protein L37AE/L43A
MSRVVPSVTAEKPYFDSLDIMDKCCSICGRRLNTIANIWFCSRCYNDWKEAILGKEPWVIYLRKLEQARRYKIKTMKDLGIKLVYLGVEWDIDENGNLVHRDRYNQNG